MKNGVRRSSQMSLKMSGQKIRHSGTGAGKMPRIVTTNTGWKEKNPGNGLDTYVLDLMKLG